MTSVQHSHSISHPAAQSGRWLIPLILLTAVLNISACSNFISSASNQLANNVTKGLISQDDPDIARLGTPAYLVLIDGFIESDPNDVAMLSAGAELYDAYASAFVEEQQAQQTPDNKSIRLRPSRTLFTTEQYL